MNINPDDAWYPNPYRRGENCPHKSAGDGGCPACLGVTIRLKLAAEMMKSPQLIHACIPANEKVALRVCDRVDGAFALADAMLDRANREEETDDGK